jgi:hypothetical protein
LGWQISTTAIAQVCAQLGDNERHALAHETANKMDVTAQAVELGHNDRAPGLAGGFDGSGKLRAAIERVGAFATLLFGFLSFVTRGLPR